jgi:hypothetical protein
VSLMSCRSAFFSSASFEGLSTVSWGSLRELCLVWFLVLRSTVLL